MAANEAKTFETAVKVALERICQHNGWVVGHAWRLSGPNELTSTKVWHCVRRAGQSEQELPVLRGVREKARLSIDDPFVGAVIRTARPQWIADLDKCDKPMRDCLEIGRASCRERV